MRRRRRPHGRRFIVATEPETLYADLLAAQAADRTNPIQRRRDFQEVFLGGAAGKRVLHTLLAWTHLYRSSVVAGDPHATHVLEGERNIGLRILGMLILEPAPPRKRADDPVDAGAVGEP
jgi:hypothetical protein